MSSTNCHSEAWMHRRPLVRICSGYPRLPLSKGPTFRSRPVAYLLVLHVGFCHTFITIFTERMDVTKCRDRALVTAVHGSTLESKRHIWSLEFHLFKERTIRPSLFMGCDRAWTVCHGFQFSGFAFIALRGVLSRSIVFVSMIDFFLMESGSFIVRHACFYPALRARLNLDHSHCLHVSLSGLRNKNGWHSVHMDSINMITENYGNSNETIPRLLSP